ncbi:unnamed protein product [Nezara viridula]|uniref:Uncharacterized protein n=1 Tax=Nezara viridula TaxID=85310 RepID=A0A9P0MN89_NEZVI|nr:unnamed protein product [Nezara viridula]
MEIKTETPYLANPLSPKYTRRNPNRSRTSRTRTDQKAARDGIESKISLHRPISQQFSITCRWKFMAHSASHLH